MGGSPANRPGELGAKVLAAAPLVVAELDREGAIAYVNPYFERLTGLCLDAIRGKDWFDTVIPEHERGEGRALLQQLDAAAPLPTTTSTLLVRAGEPRRIEWTFEALRDGGGTATGLLILGRDVTERARAQEELSLGKQRLDETGALANVGAWQLDLRTQATWWSDEQYRMFGVPVGTTMTMDAIVGQILPEDRALFQGYFDGALATGYQEGVYRILRTDGATRHILARARVTYAADGSPAVLSGATQDITERWEAEEAARRWSELLHTVVAGAPIVLFALDRDGVFTLSEGRALAHLGVRPGEVVGRSAFELYPHQPEFPAIFRRALAGEEVIQVVREAGRDFEIAYVPSYDAGGAVDGVIGVAFDVTERHRAEAEARASALAQQRLVEELRLADRRKDDFIAVLSHELRNPLSAIRSGLFLLSRAQPGAPLAQRASSIVDRQVQQLARLVDDLLDVSRITQHKIQLRRAPVELGALVRAAIDDYASLFESHGVRLELQLAGGPLVVDGDAARLVQVLGNLLQNAVKFTPAGGRTTVTLERGPDGASAVLRVADTGAGIEPSLFARMFEPFTQADRTLARSGGGLGLGLTLVRGLVELHGGTVTVHSAGVGQGAEFVVQLPLAAAAAASAGAGTRPAGPVEHRRVLLIEDNRDVAETLCTILQLEGHSVEVEHDGPSGIRRARELRPDIVLCDLGLPGASGYDVARELRRDEALRKTALVALSGYAAAEDVARAHSAGFDQHLAKPVELDRLRDLVAAAS